MKHLQTTLSLTAMSALALGFSAITLHAQEPASTAPVINWAHIKGSNQIEILGNNFGTTKGTVSVSGSPAAVQFWSNTLIDVVNPLNEPITSQLVVTTAAKVKAAGSVFNMVGTLSTTASTRDNSELVTMVQINGGTNQAHVSPGGTVNLTFGYACPNCVYPLQFGFSTGAPQACIPLATGAGSSSVGLVAPTTPGLYYILIDDNVNQCQPVWDYGIPPVSQAVATILVY